MYRLFLSAICMPLTALFAQFAPKPAIDDIQTPCDGKIVRWANFKSQYVESRHIDIWLPSGYDNTKKYTVLYMHDGQMLFDSSSTWNKQAWNVDDVASSLLKANRIKPVLVVGIWNVGTQRYANYFPQKPYEQLSKLERDSVVAQLQRRGRTTSIFHPNSDNYLKFLVHELKPKIDSAFRVHRDAKNTFVAGSSMGGLISMYAICEYPDVFGGAACLSTHWTGMFKTENNPIPNAFLTYLKEKLPNPKKHKLYFDCGDQTLDALYPSIQREVDTVLINKGYNSKNWKTGYHPGKNHSEKAWSERIHIPLLFLAGKK